MAILALVVVLFLSACSDDKIKPEVQSIDEVANRFIEETHYPGLSIAIYKNSETVFSHSYGYSDIHLKTPFSSDEVLALGSNVKTLVAASILLLEESNKLKLTDKVNQHLPFKLRQENGVTIKDMLCHVSDLPDVFGGESFENYSWQKAISQKEFIDKLNENNEQISPRTEYRYNNTAYFLLGLVIEHISNQPLGDYFRERLFSPLQIDQAYYLADSYYYPQLAKMYEIDGNDALDYEDPVDYRVVAGAGALGGNISSYSKLFSGILAGSILSETSKAKMKTPCKLADGTFAINTKNQKTGLGVEITETDAGIIYSRGGAMNGHVSAIYHFEKAGLTLAIVGNAFMPLAGVLDAIVENNLYQQFN